MEPNIEHPAQAPKSLLKPTHARCRNPLYLRAGNMSSVLKRLRNLSKKDKGRSQTSSPTPSVGSPSTSHATGGNLNPIPTLPANDSPGEKKKLYLEAGITVLKHLKEISEASDVLAPLKAACGATTAILETIVAMDSNKEAWKSTLQVIERHRSTFEQQLTNMNGQKIAPSTEPGLLDPIKAYGRDLESILGALMLENGILAQDVPHESMFRNLGTFMKRYGTVKVEAEKVSGYVDQLDAAMKQFTASLTMYTGFKVHSIEQRLVALDAKLSVVNPGIVNVEIKLKPRPRLVPNFMDREDIFEAMQHAHFRNHHVRTQVITILSGIGGLGKTQMALKFAMEFEERFPDIPIYFLDASALDKLQTDLEILIRSRGTAYHTKSYEDALVWLATELKNWLIILDNADDPNVDPVPYIPQCAFGHVVITTRNATLASLAPNNSHALDGLPTHDAVVLLLTASNYPDIEENRELAAKIARELGHLPLALSHAAGYILVHHCLGSYLDMYRKNREKILSSTNSRLLHNYRSSVTMTITMSLEKLSDRAIDIMQLFSHLQATSISHSMIVKAAERQFRWVEWTRPSSLNPETLKQADVLGKIFCRSGEWSEFDFNEDIRECLQYSLLQLTTQKDARFYSMHVLVQSHLQATGLVHDHQPKRLVCRLLGSTITLGNPYDFLAFNRLLLPHIRLVRVEDVIEAGDHYGLGNVLNEIGDARLAVVHLEKCVEMWRESFGKEDGHTIAAMVNLAISYGDVGNIQAALELQEEVLSLQKRLLGPEHPDTMRSMTKLSITYSRAGRSQAAVELGEEVLSLQKRLLGPEHPDTMNAMGNLAVYYKDSGKGQAALELEEEVLLLRKRLLGPEHPDTMNAMGNLALYYKDTGKGQAALELEEEVLLLQKRLLGPEHPDTMRTMGNIAVTYRYTGKNQTALELELELLSLQRRLFGPEHPETLLGMNNLAVSYIRMGKYQAAMELGEEALLLQKRLLGLEHPHTMLSMSNLALTYEKMGKNQAALELREEALSLQTRLLGPQHPNTLTTMQNQLATYQTLDMQTQRLNLLRIAVPAHETAESYGIDHPDTVKLRNELNELSAPVTSGSE